MWMRNAVADIELQAVDVDETFFTLIPSRFPTIDVFARVANDRSAELAAIESLTNPRIRERERAAGIAKAGSPNFDGGGGFGSDSWFKNRPP